METDTLGYAIGKVSSLMTSEQYSLINWPIKAQILLKLANCT